MSTTILRSLLTCAMAAVATAAAAEVPRVATDIAPVHGLVARVMDGVGEPDLMVEPGASPHGYSMRPSEARALEQADAVFWIGPELEPWLGDTIGTLAADAEVIELLDATGTITLDFRQGATYAPHDHGGAGDTHESNDHDEHAEEGEGHAHENSGHDGHHHDGIDPHAWLDPENGKVWLDLIAEELSALDPENAGTYRSNAAAGRAEIDTAIEEVRATLSGLEDLKFVVFHDAYHYFENRFEISAAGAISLGDASDPSPARIEEVRETVTALGASCVFSEPQYNQRLVRTVLDGTDGHAGVIDPLGFEIPTGPDFYPDLIRSVADEIAECAS